MVLVGAKQIQVYAPIGTPHGEDSLVQHPEFRAGLRCPDVLRILDAGKILVLGGLPLPPELSPLPLLHPPFDVVPQVVNLLASPSEVVEECDNTLGLGAGPIHAEPAVSLQQCCVGWVNQLDGLIRHCAEYTCRPDIGLLGVDGDGVHDDQRVRPTSNGSMMHPRVNCQHSGPRAPRIDHCRVDRRVKGLLLKPLHTLSGKGIVIVPSGGTRVILLVHHHDVPIPLEPETECSSDLALGVDLLFTDGSAGGHNSSLVVDLRNCRRQGISLGCPCPCAFVLLGYPLRVIEFDYSVW